MDNACFGNACYMKRAVRWKIEQATSISGKLFGPGVEERIRFYRRHGYFLRLSHPRSFNEKVCQRRIAKPVPNSSILADKYAVRDWVKSKGYGSILNDILLVARRVEEIDFDGLPSSFVLKATHGSGWNILVQDKSSADFVSIRKQCQTWLNSDYSAEYYEPHYSLIQPGIIIEHYLSDGIHSAPLDYKFFVFHGRCHYILVDHDRFSNHKRTIYNTRWEAQPFSLEYPPEAPARPPGNLKQMISIAEGLASELDFCRVDLYSLNDRGIVFGEMTLTPGAGRSRFHPVSADFELGKLW